MKSAVCILVFLLSVTSFIFLLPTGNCQTQSTSYLYVGGSGVGNYSRIQNAIDNASIDSTIFVYSGIYNEQLTITLPLRVIGENKHTTIINGTGTGSVIVVNSNGATIQGFTIQNSGTVFPHAGITLTSHYNRINENILWNNFYGMVLLASSHNIIIDNIIIDNNQCGIYFSGATFNVLIHNTVHNHPFNGFGLYDFSDENTIQGNTFAHNQFYGVNIRDSSDNHIYDNMFSENRVGIHIPPPIFRTLVEDNFFIENDSDITEEKDFIQLSWTVFGLLSILGFFVLKKRFHIR